MGERLIRKIVDAGDFSGLCCDGAEWRVARASRSESGVIGPSVEHFDQADGHVDGCRGTARSEREEILSLNLGGQLHEDRAREVFLTMDRCSGTPRSEKP